MRGVELLDTGHTRFPVTGTNGVDDVVGVVAIGDLLAVPAAARGTTPVGAISTEALFIPARQPLRAVLDELRRRHRQLACVIDEYGGFAGVITLEDVAEELVGPILDEDDLPEPDARRGPDGTWQVPGRWRVDEVADATGIALPDSDAYETLSGLILERLGRIPVVGDEIELDLVRGGTARVRVVAVRRRVPAVVELRRGDGA